MVVILPKKATSDLRETAGGVLLPQTADNEPMEGTVVALGDGQREPISSSLAQILAKRASVFIGGFEYDGEPYMTDFANDLIAASSEPIPFEVKVGDVVTFVPWMATSIKPPGSDEDFYLVSEANIIGIVVP